jgi:hypothetical protein
MAVPWMGVAVSAAFCVLFTVCLALNVSQIVVVQKRNKNIQNLNKVLTRLGCLYNICNIINQARTCVTYFLEGESFRLSYALGNILSVTAVCMCVTPMGTYMVYNLMNATKPIAGKSKGMGFVAINVANLVISEVVTGFKISLDREWLGGICQIIWSLFLFLILYFAWSYSLALQGLRRHRSIIGVGLGASEIESGYWKSLRTLTVVITLVGLSMLASTAVQLSDTEMLFYPETPAFALLDFVNDMLHVLTSVGQVYHVWLPLQATDVLG